MKSIKLFFLAMLALVAAGFAACTEDDFKPGPGVDGAQVYFPETIPDQINLAEGASSFTIPVKRIATEGALSIAIMSVDESGLFTIPSSVNFADGQGSADLVITYDQAQIDGDKEYPIALLLNDEKNTTPYGYSSLNVTVALWPWESLGKGKFRDDWFLSPGYGSSDPNPEIEVTIHEHKSKKGVYMIENMYGWPFLTEFFKATQEEIEADGFDCTYTPTNITINCSDPNAVTLPLQNSGLVNKDPSLGAFQIATYKATPGTLVDGVITFPKEGLAFVYADGKGQIRANKSSLFRIVLPGYEAVDYSLTATYDGMRVSADGETASAVIDFGYGADVTGISYVFAPGDVTAEAAQYAAKIADGTAENIAEVPDFIKGEEHVLIQAELANAGSYTIIAVPNDKDNKPRTKEVAADAFYFPGLGGNTNPVDIAAALIKVSEYPDAADYIDQYPDHSSMVYEISGTEITSVKTYMNKTAVIESAPSMGMTLQQIMDQYGKALAASALTKLNETGKYWDIFINLSSTESYTLLVEATNAYGKKKLISSDPLSTTAIPYNGEMVIGKYTMTHVANPQNTFTNVFNVMPTVGSDTKFQILDFACDNEGTLWNAEYDPTASTLTLDGTIAGSEDPTKNYFGEMMGFWDAAETQIYGFVSFANEESQGTDPCVIEVDAATKQLSVLKNQIQVPVMNAQSGDLLGYGGFYVFDTPITKVAANSSVASQFPAIRSIGVPFSSIRVPANRKSLRNRFGTMAAESVRKTGFSDNRLRTLSVKSAKCEPLPRQTGFRAILRTDLNAPIREVMK